MLLLALGDALARLLLLILPYRISNRIKENTTPRTTYVLRTQSYESPSQQTTSTMTLFEAVFATLLFDLALFGTNNILINTIISTFTSIQNSWDTPFTSPKHATDGIRNFCKRLHIQMDPWIWDKPIDEYTSLNNFFSRTYSPKYFPRINALNGRLSSPACCRMTSYNDDSSLKSILIKGCEYDINKIGLPTNDGDMEKYKSNHIILGYLSPKDYHRVHAPISVSIRVSSVKCVHVNDESSFRIYISYILCLHIYIIHTIYFRERLFIVNWKESMNYLHQ